MLSALSVGFAMGIFRLAVDRPVKLFENFAYDQGSFFWIVNNIFFQYFSLIIFAVSVIIMFVVSYLTEEPDYEKISGLTYGTMTAEHKAETRNSWNILDVVTSSIVIVLILAVYIYFYRLIFIDLRK